VVCCVVVKRDSRSTTWQHSALTGHLCLVEMRLSRATSSRLYSRSLALFHLPTRFAFCHTPGPSRAPNASRLTVYLAHDMRGAHDLEERAVHSGASAVREHPR
jgi:hypothetical protein